MLVNPSRLMFQISIILKSLTLVLKLPVFAAIAALILALLLLIVMVISDIVLIVAAVKVSPSLYIL